MCFGELVKCERVLKIVQEELSSSIITMMMMMMMMMMIMIIIITGYSQVPKIESEMQGYINHTYPQQI